MIMLLRYVGKLSVIWMNPWFTRCWILQEAVLTDSVVRFYGTAICSLNAITKRVELFSTSF